MALMTLRWGLPCFQNGSARTQQFRRRRFERFIPPHLCIILSMHFVNSELEQIPHPFKMPVLLRLIERSQYFLQIIEFAFNFIHEGDWNHTAPPSKSCARKSIIQLISFPEDHHPEWYTIRPSSEYPNTIHWPEWLWLILSLLMSFFWSHDIIYSPK